MRKAIVVSLPADTRASSLASLYAALGFVDRSRIRREDYQSAARRALALRALSDRAPYSLTLSEQDAEDLLAECDAVHHSLAPRAPLDCSSARALETFRRFRHAVYRACSAAPERQAA